MLCYVCFKVKSMPLDAERSIQCPYCGSMFWVYLDLSAGSSIYIEDCETCCKPIEFVLTVEEWEVESLELRRMD